MSSYIIVCPNELNHYGVKGMRWGVRKQLPLAGNRQSNRSVMTSQDIARRQAQRRARAKKAAIIGGSIAATALVAYGGYKLGKINGIQGKQLIEKGQQFLINKYANLSYTTNRVRNVTRVARNARRAVTAPLTNNVAVRTTRRVISTPARVIRKTRMGRTALKVYGAAALASDANSAYQWTTKMKKQGKIRKGDIKDLAKDLINPIPDNIPGLNKKKR